jgi:squalene-associated FAD-dependent desaturase
VVNPSSSKTALIAGAGLAGLAAAVFLDEMGYRVTLLEKRPVCGGRTYSFQDRKTGFSVDNGQHLLIGAYHETFSFLERIGAKRNVSASPAAAVPLFDEKGEKAFFRLGGLPPPFGLAAAVLRYPRFSTRDKWGFLRLGRELVRIKKGKSALPSGLTVAAWLKRNGQTENAVKNFWEVLTLATLNDSPELASADALATVLIKSYFAGRRDGELVFPKTGLTGLFVEPALDYLKARGQDVIKGLGLKSVRILDDRVHSFTLTDGSVRKADLFVTAIPPHRLIGVLPEPFVASRNDLLPLRSFSYAPIVSINLFYDRPVMDDAFAGSSATRVHWFFNRGTAHPAESLHHVIGVVSGAYDLANATKDDIVRLAAEDLAKLYPRAAEAKLVHALANVERQATLSCRVGVNALRPKQRLLENFFAIGDWTDTGLPPTIESAVVSARKLVQALERPPRTPG